MKVELLPFEQDICLAFATVYSYPQEDWEDSKALLEQTLSIVNKYCRKELSLQPLSLLIFV